MNTSLKVFCLISSFALLNSGLSYGTIFNVPGDATTIQGAVDLASPGDVIEIECGTYADCTHPDFLGYNNCVIMTSGITLRGLGADPSCVVIDASGGRGILCGDLSQKVTIENLTIRNGFITGEGLTRPIDAIGGGGIWTYSSEVDIMNCNFDHNSGDWGGAVLADGPDVLISQCQFVDNLAFNFGGGVVADGGTLEFCHFTSNSSYGLGGAIYGLNTVMESCLLDYNTASLGGGGALGVNLEMWRCSVQNNTVEHGDGGGVLMHGDLYAFNTDFLFNTVVSPFAGDNGFVSDPYHADLICCDTDISTWAGPGTINHDMTVCEDVVSQEELTWGSVKVLYR